MEVDNGEYYLVMCLYTDENNMVADFGTLKDAQDYVNNEIEEGGDDGFMIIKVMKKNNKRSWSPHPEWVMMNNKRRTIEE